MPSIPQIARVPHTSKPPEACPHCGSHALTRRGTRTKKLEIVQLWRCASCKRTFTPDPAPLHHKTCPLRKILSALTDYDLGYSLHETADRLQKKAHRHVSPCTISAWLDEYKQHSSYCRLRRKALSRFPANQSIRTIKLYHRQAYAYAGGLIAARAAAAAQPDGHTLFMALTSTFVVFPEMQANLPFNVNDFVPIGFVG